MKKGITPVIAVVLLLMIALVIVGLAFTWFVSTQQLLQEEGEQEGERQIANIQSMFRVEGSKGNRIFIRNDGISDITAESFSIYLNKDRVRDEYIIITPIPPGKVGVLLINVDVEENDIVDIYNAAIQKTVIINEDAEAQ